jgi:competence protein ComEC
VSAGRFNRYGHPDPQILARLEHAGARVWRTDRDGTITVRVRRDGAYTVSAGRR